MIRIISVRPRPGGWDVAIDGATMLAFPTGGRAEAAARGVAARYAGCGQSAEVRIYLRDGSLAGRLLSGPPTEAARPDAA